jgi:hypothetical protein
LLTLAITFLFIAIFAAVFGFSPFSPGRWCACGEAAGKADRPRRDAITTLTAN